MIASPLADPDALPRLLTWVIMAIGAVAAARRTRSGPARTRPVRAGLAGAVAAAGLAVAMALLTVGAERAAGALRRSLRVVLALGVVGGALVALPAPAGAASADPRPTVPSVRPCAPGAEDRDYSVAAITLDVPFNRWGRRLGPAHNRRLRPRPLVLRANAGECVKAPMPYAIGGFALDLGDAGRLAPHAAILPGRELPPGTTLSGALTFDVPEAARTAVLTFERTGATVLTIPADGPAAAHQGHDGPATSR
jgi:hypothetical protein